MSLLAAVPAPVIAPAPLETYHRDGDFLVCDSCDARTLRVGCRHTQDCAIVLRTLFVTPRQRTIALMIADGKSTAQIADELGITRSTVLVHRHEMYRRLGIHGVAQLVRKLYQFGVLIPESAVGVAVAVKGRP